jgi:hypothetical protein
VLRCPGLPLHNSIFAAGLCRSLARHQSYPMKDSIHKNQVGRVLITGISKNFIESMIEISGDGVITAEFAASNAISTGCSKTLGYLRRLCAMAEVRPLGSYPIDLLEHDMRFFVTLRTLQSPYQVCRAFWR